MTFDDYLSLITLLVEPTQFLVTLIFVENIDSRF